MYSLQVARYWLYKGFVCYIIHHDTFDTYNGYVEIPRDHPIHGVDYDSINIDVHGGVTYGDKNEITGEFTIGFDTNHFGDAYGENVHPDLKNSLNSGTYRDITFVENETNGIVNQLTEKYYYDNSNLLKTSSERLARFVLNESIFSNEMQVFYALIPKSFFIL